MSFTKNEIRIIISDILQCPAENIHDDTPLAELGYDSLKFIASVVEIESKYGIEVLTAILLRIISNALTLYAKRSKNISTISHLSSLNASSPIATAFFGTVSQEKTATIMRTTTTTLTSSARFCIRSVKKAYCSPYALKTSSPTSKKCSLLRRCASMISP